jgi:DNA-binding transcriptional ArsR family regulator
MAAASAELVYRAIADPTRRAILDQLKRTECSVKDLTHSFTMSQQAVSQHLDTLRAARLVTSRRVGRESRYRLTPAPLRSVVNWLEQYRQFLDPSGHQWRLVGASARHRTRS